MVTVLITLPGGLQIRTGFVASKVRLFRFIQFLAVYGIVSCEIEGYQPL